MIVCQANAVLWHPSSLPVLAAGEEDMAELCGEQTLTNRAVVCSCRLMFS